MYKYPLKSFIYPLKIHLSNESQMYSNAGSVGIQSRQFSAFVIFQVDVNKSAQRICCVSGMAFRRVKVK